MLKTVRAKLIVGMIVLIAILYAYWQYQLIYPYTSDAYVQANVLQITPRISGQIIRVNVHDNQAIKKGTLLLQIDPKSYQLAVQLAAAKVMATQESIKAMQQQLKALLETNKGLQASLDYYNKLVKMYRALETQSATSRNSLENYIAKRASIQAEVEATKHKISRLHVLIGSKEHPNADLLVDNAELAQAKLNLAHTKIYAPADGWITQLNIRVGSYANAGQGLFALVESKQWWITANFLEIFMRNIHVKQPVSIKIAMFPGRKYQGVVEGIGAGISRGDHRGPDLLPQVNETMNWIQLIRRFPVRITLLKQPGTLQLRNGSSAVVSIDTRSSE